MANHQLDADDVRAVISEVRDNVAVQQRMLATVISELALDATKLLGLKALDNRLNFSAGMLSGRIKNDLEGTIHQLTAIADTLDSYYQNL
jgi:hypothetical protein